MPALCAKVLRRGVAGERSSWRDFSFIVSSHHREQVFSALKERPKLPHELASDTRLRISHVSRSLRELSQHRLVECLTPELRGRGRLYSLTPAGREVLHRILQPDAVLPPTPSAEGPPSQFVPKVRASSVLRVVAFLKKTRTPVEVEGLLQAWRVPVEGIDEDTWLPITACARLLDLMEERFGDGSYGYIRRTFSEAAATFPTVLEQISRGLPLTLLARRAPAVYAKEWNFGRMEVETGNRWSVMRHFDWAPTPAMCSMFHGIYEGVLKSRKVEGRVVKSRCVRSGDPCCEYRAEW